MVGVALPGAASASSTAGAPPKPIDEFLDLGGFDPEPWRPYREEDFALPAGEYCSYALRGHIVEDEELVRVDSRYANGAVHVNEYKGTLIIDFTNLDSGQTVRRDLSGRGWEELRPDGSIETFAGVGPFGSAFSVTDDHPAGQYVLDGIHVLEWDANGQKSMPVAIGSEENLCHTLS